MKLLHFADLHLDTGFASLGSARAARARREALRHTLARLIALAQAERVDAVFCGGDLYEHDRFSPDTADFLRRAFAELHPIRVFIAPGNHDWYGAESLYRRVAWSDNVRVFTEPRLTPVELADGLTLWGAAHVRPAGTGNFLEGFVVDRAGAHLALFHGSERSALREQGETKVAHAPFAAEDIRTAGIDHVFLGHYHLPRLAPQHTYPGNPDPLAFGETGTRGAVIAHVRPDGTVMREQRAVAASIVHDVEVDVSGCTNRQDVCNRVAASLVGRGGIARITLHGELAPQVDFMPADLDAVTKQLDAVVVRAARLQSGYDFDAIAAEPTVRGQFVRDVRAAELEPGRRQRILVTGMRALDGRDDLEVL